MAADALPPSHMMAQLSPVRAQQNGQPNEAQVLNALFEAFKPGTRNSGMEISRQEFTDTPQFLSGRLRQARQMAETMGKVGDGRSFATGVGLPELGVAIRVRYKAGEPAQLIVQEKEQNSIDPNTGMATVNIKGHNGPSALYENWIKRGLMGRDEYMGDGYYTTAAYEIGAKGELKRLDARQINHGEFGLAQVPGSRWTGVGKPSFEPTVILRPGALNASPFGPDGQPLEITPKPPPVQPQQRRQGPQQLSV